MAGRIGYVKRMKRAPHPVCKTALKAPKRSRDYAGKNNALSAAPGEDARMKASPTKKV